MSDPVLDILIEARRIYTTKPSRTSYVHQTGCCAGGSLVIADPGMQEWAHRQYLGPGAIYSAWAESEDRVRATFDTHSSEAGKKALALLCEAASQLFPACEALDRPFGTFEAVNQRGSDTWRDDVLLCFDRVIADRKAMLAEHHVDEDEAEPVMLVFEDDPIDVEPLLALAG